MKYRTVIEITTEANNPNEALDLAGEFLRGNIENGVDMKYTSRSVKGYTLLKVCVVVVLLSLFAGTLFFGSGTSKRLASKRLNKARTSVLQPPLRTCSLASK